MPDKIDDWGLLARAWWRSLQRTHETTGRRNRDADPGAVARLRRASSPIEAAQEQVTLQLYATLGFGAYNHERLERVAVLAATLAHVQDDVRGREGDGPARLGELLGGDPPIMSDLRVRRLCAARDAAETMRGFREAVSLLGGAAPIASLARTVLDWLDEERGDQARTRLLFDYHGASFAAPQGDGDEAHASND